MTIERATPPARIEPVVDRTGGLSGVGRLIVLSFGIVGVSIGLMLVGPNRGEPFLLGLLGILAVIGVVTLFASAIGLVRFSGRGQGEDVAKSFVDTMQEGVLLADRDGRIVYANRAYADLIGATGERDLHAVDRAFSGNPDATEAIYRIAQDLREGRSAEEEVRMPTPIGVRRG